MRTKKVIKTIIRFFSMWWLLDSIFNLLSWAHTEDEDPNLNK